MRFSHAEHKDLKKIRKQFFPISKEISPYDRALELRNDLKGMVVRPKKKEELIGCALYEITADQITVAALKTQRFNIEVGQMLADGLRSLAQESHIQSIWLISDGDTRTREFFAKCGFRPMAFFRLEPDDVKSPRMTYWKLPEGKDANIREVRPNE
jgi:N-acetylglutamate synthase-like GNAT family acetyltransferase